MMRKVVILLIAILGSVSLSAQDSTAVKVEQTPAFTEALQRVIVNNSGRKVSGYRIRIYFDSSRDARQVSEAIAARFTSEFPGVSVYRNYSSPFFKVTVGDFRTRAEASLFAKQLEGNYPSAFLVKEAISFPSL